MAQIRADAAAAAAAAAAKPKTPPQVASGPAKTPVAPAKTPAAPAKTPAAPVKPAPSIRPTPRPAPPQTVVTGPKGGALQQAQNAANAGANAGNVFDGSNGAKTATPGSVVTVPAVTGPKAGPVLTKPGAPDLAGSVPSVPPAPADQSFMDSIMKLKTGPPSTPWHQHMPTIAGGLLLGLAGFFLGGPIGALIGAAVGAAAGHFISKLLFS
jgi:hypothetical protein